MIKITDTGRFVLADDQDLTPDKLAEFIQAHDVHVQSVLAPLSKAYKTKYKIFDLQKKAAYKPDNRIAANFAKYIVDTFEGFFAGIPMQISSDDAKVADYLTYLRAYTDGDDNNAELSKLMSIYGYGYEMYYVDEAAEIGITHLSPMDAFMVYDESILERPRYFVRVYTDSHNVRRGSLSDDTVVRYFRLDPDVIWEEEHVHGFDGVPASEFVMNADRISLIAPVMSMIDAYNKALSEKANDVDYFADAYLKILGAKLKNDDLKTIRDDRIINFAGINDGKLVVDFLQKPDGDTSQEHLLDRLERLIFQISMVANISDESFGTASGQALKYKLHAMSSLAKTKERKFTSGLNRRYRLIFSNPVAGMQPDAWTRISYAYTQNIPSNELEEAQTAARLSGIVSRATQLRCLSMIDDVNAEIDRIKAEDEADLPDARSGDFDDESGDD